MQTVSDYVSKVNHITCWLDLCPNQLILNQNVWDPISYSNDSASYL